jgi:hypothetical protein
MTQKRDMILTRKIAVRDAPLAVGRIAVGRSTLR